MLTITIDLVPGGFTPLKRTIATTLITALLRRARKRSALLRGIASLPRVLLHRLVDEVVDAAFQLARHLLERLPQHVAALEHA